MYVKRLYKRKQPLIVCFDTETYNTHLNDDILIRPYLIGWYYENIFDYSVEPHEKFFNFLKEKQKTHKLILWAHNANYDLTVLLPEYLSTFKGCYCDYKISEAKRFIKFKYKCDDFKFVCKDTMIWNAQISSLNDWLNFLGLAKKVEGFIYEKWDVELKDNNVFFNDKYGNLQPSSNLIDELTYLKWDVEGLMNVVKYQENQKSDLCNMLIPYKKKIATSTAPSMIKRLIDSFIGKTGWFDETFRPVIPNEGESYQIYAHMVNSNIGGFTGFNKSKFVWEYEDEIIKSYDINSMYPYIMYMGLPCGLLLTKKPKEKHVIWYEISVDKCEWIDEFSHISTTPIPKRVCDSHLNFFICKDYYDFVKKYSVNNIEILDTYYQRVNNDLGRFIKNLFKLKLKVIDIEDEEKRRIKLSNLKLALNSIYGKLCERTYDTDTFYDLEMKTFRSNKVHVDEFRYTLSGVYVTQMSRTVILKNIIEEIRNGNDFIYADTDSIKLVVNNPVILPIHPFNLGFYKEEGWGPEKNRGYTNFYCNTKKKKNLIYSKKDLSSIKLTLGGVLREIISDLVMSRDVKLLKSLFDVNKNIVINMGGKRNKKNIYSQKNICSVDISLNGFAKDATHILKKVDNIWKLFKK